MSQLGSSAIHSQNSGRRVWHFPSEATTSWKFGVRNFVESFGFRISRQLIRFAEPGVTDLFVYWISLEK